MKSNYAVRGVLFLVCLVGVIAAPAFADGPYANSASFTGQGTTANGSGGYNLNTEICGDGADADHPYLLWVLTATGAGNAEITGPWGTATMTQPQHGNGAFKYVSGFYDLATLVVSATYDGDPTNAQLVISHGCAPACTKPAAPGASNGGPYCYNGTAVTINLSAGDVTGGTYSWTGPNGFSPPGQNVTDSASGPGSGEYCVTVTLNGCTSDKSCTIVTVNATPAKPQPSNNGPKCFYSNPTTVQLHSNVPSTDVDSYSWTGPGLSSSSASDPTADLTAPDTYHYTLTVTKNGCTSDAGSTDVVINQPPAVSVLAGGPLTFCRGGSVTLSAVATGTGPFSYSWTGPTNFSSNASSIVAIASGSYSVAVTDANGCSTSSGSTVVTTLFCACSLTQGAYGSTGGAGSVTQVAGLIGGGLSIGGGTRTFGIISADAPCFVLRMPAGGQPAALPNSATYFTSGLPTCGQTNAATLVSKGKFVDVLMGQTFTLSLNVRGDAGLSSVPLCTNMQTQKLIGNVPDPNYPAVAFTMPSSVINALGGPGVATVGGLLNLANAALGGSTAVPLADINLAVNNVNVYFDGCRAEMACQ